MSLHPQAKSFLDGLASQNAPGWEKLSPEEGREIFSSIGEFFGEAPEVDRVEDRDIGDGLGVRISSTLTGCWAISIRTMRYAAGWQTLRLLLLLSTTTQSFVHLEDFFATG